MKLKKMLAIAMAGVMTLSLVACGSSDTSSSSGDSTGSTTTETAGTESTSSGDKTVITAWAWDPAFNLAALEEAARVYAEANPDINIELEIVEYSQPDIIQKLNAGLGAGSTNGLPNLVLIEDYRAQTFLQSYPGQFADLSSITDESKFSAHKLGSMYVDGVVYGVPFDNGAAVLYYRRDLFEQAGYTEEDMLTLTMEEYIVAGQKIMDETGVQLLTLDPNDVAQLRMMMLSAGTWYCESDGATPNFANNEALKYATELYVELLNSGLAKTISDWSQFVGAPNNGEVASVPTGCWFTPSITQAEDQAGLWGIAPFPSMEGVAGSVNASNLGGSSFYVLENVAGAAETIEFLGATFAGNDEMYEELLVNNGILPTYLPVFESDVFSVEVEYFNNQAIFEDISEWTTKIPSINYGIRTYEFEDIMKAELQNILAGIDIDTAFDNAQAQAEAQFQ